MAQKWSRAPKLVLWGSEYEGDGRAYVNPATDERVPSVTSVLKHAPKADLMGWSALKVAERARDRPDIVMGDPDKVVDRLRYAHTDFRDERAWVGSGVHRWVEADFEGSWDRPELDEEQEAMYENWLDFCETYKVKVLYSEFTVWLEFAAGTGDAIIECTDPFSGETFICLIDLKTSRKLWEEHKLQLSALAHAKQYFQEVGPGDGGHRRKGRVKAEDSWWILEDMPHFDKVGIVHLREKFWDFEIIPNEHLPVYYKKFKLYVQIDKVSREIAKMEKEE